jgi:hypothetical protein
MATQIDTTKSYDVEGRAIPGALIATDADALAAKVDAASIDFFCATYLGGARQCSIALLLHIADGLGWRHVLGRIALEADKRVNG